MRRASVLVALLAAAGFSGCKGSDSTSTAVTTPDPATLTPYGTIQGRLTDRVTNQPVVGAVLSIGLAVAATDANGQFVIANVPATRDALNNTVSGSYLITIDLQRVTSPVAMASNPAIAYPKFAYASANVNYTSLDDTNGTQPGAGSGSNHDTPVVGLVAGFDLDVAKLAAGFTGVVYGCDTAPGALSQTPVGLGYTVRLFDHGDSSNTGSGADQYVVAVTTTDANGAFAFSNVESLKAFDFEAVDTAKLFFDRVLNISSLADGLTQSVKLFACPTDNVGPMIVAVSPEPGADVSPSTVTSTATSVSFTFSEAVRQTPDMSTVPGIPGNLFDLVTVQYAGDKAGNVAHTLAWNEARTVLTVTLTTAPSGKYWIRLPGISAFKDQYGNGGSIGICPDDHLVPGTFGVTPVGAADTDCTAYFTTSGAPNASAPTGLVVINANLIDASGVNPQLDWLPSTGAKAYNVYRQCFQWPGYPVAATGALAASAEPGTTVLLTATPTANTQYTDTSINTAPNTGFIEGDNIPLACIYTVKGVNSDKIESAAGPSINVADVVRPQISAAFFQNTTAATQLTIPNPNTATVTFNEDMAESVSETATNYVITARPGFAAPTVASVQYVSRVATLAFPAAGTAGALEWAIVPAGGLCPNVTLAANDARTAALYNGGGAAPPPLPTCVQPNGLNLTAAAVASILGDDVPCGAATATTNAGVCAGPDGICNTGPGTGDIAVTPVGSMPKCVTAGTDGVLETAPNGGKVLNSIAGITVQAAVTDVAGNAISPAHDHVGSTLTTNAGTTVTVLPAD